MKTIAIAALLLIALSAQASAWVSCENDRICSGTQICKDGYCQEKQAVERPRPTKPPLVDHKTVRPDAKVPGLETQKPR
ncbi:hypothetical protein [Pinisolibacter aquiterrae]|uniref:hypothetical protein n=1 Tax=Pinisolibacter aquiterrae TaxID=2815579 RepID=UPI001C3D4BF0|nr:hypothetical protein [Pinisolibacter aquiterrae]MBV5265526.1 hypothetical protein [Pinisolibacter aquiterrae]MCC8236907.1 hypothetical protein [Pinisolibacter aquiterrae]